MNFNSTVKGSLLEGFYPAGWDMAKIDACCNKGVEREPFWNKDFHPVSCEDIGEFDAKMGHEIALQIKNARENKSGNRKRKDAKQSASCRIS